MLISEEQFYTEETSDEVITEIIKKLIPKTIKTKLSSRKNRQLMLEKYGKKAFLLPDQLKFPIVDPDTGKPDCALLYAARLRAKQYAGVKPGYREIAAKAEQIFHENNCNTRIHIQIQNETEELNVELTNLVEILY